MADIELCKCGGMANLYYLPSTEFTVCAVICNVCGKQTPLYFDKDAAISAWNEENK